jgi:copper transport protein
MASAQGSALPRRAAALLVVLGTTIALLLGGALPASAHAALLGSTPAIGSVVQAAPAQVTLDFSESVTVAADSVKVLDPDGRRVDTGATSHADGRGSTARARLGQGVGTGTFTVAWHVISADSHPVSGAFTFSVGKPSATKVDVHAPVAGGGTSGDLYDTFRYFAYAGFALLVGTAAFALVCWHGGGARRPVQRLLLTGWSALLVCTIAMLMLRGPYANGTGVGDAFDLSVIRETLDTKPGAALAVRLLLLAGAGAFLAVLVGHSERQEANRDVRLGLMVAGAVLGIGLASTWAAMEHASVGIQPRIAVPVDVVHLCAVGVWLGGLAALLTALYAPGGRPIETAAVERFSKVAFTCVTLIVATGLYQAWRQVGFSWHALGSTDYGRLLIAKVAVVAVLVGAGWFSRRYTRGLRGTGAVAAAGSTGGAAAGKAAAGSTGEAVAVKVAGNEAAAGEAANGKAATGNAVAAEQTGAGTAVTARTGTAETGTAKAATPKTAAKTAARTPGTKTPPAKTPAAKAARPPGSGRSGNPARAAELARQRAAVAAARARRQRDAEPGRARLRGSVLVEVCVAVVVLTLTTFLTTTEPARTVEEAARATGTSAAARPTGPVSVTLPYDTGGKNGKGRAVIGIAPARTGPNTVHVQLSDAGGQPVDVPEVDVTFTLKAKKIGPLAARLKHIDTGHWTAEGVALPLPGTWELSVSVRTSDIDETTVTKNIQIG